MNDGSATSSSDDVETTLHYDVKTLEYCAEWRVLRFRRDKREEVAASGRVWVEDGEPTALVAQGKAHSICRAIVSAMQGSEPTSGDSAEQQVRKLCELCSAGHRLEPCPRCAAIAAIIQPQTQRQTEQEALKRLCRDAVDAYTYGDDVCCAALYTAVEAMAAVLGDTEPKPGKES